MRTTLNLQNFISELPELIYNGESALAPQEDDLDRLYKMIRDRANGRVLEFGCGYSTFAIARALKQNKEDFGEIHTKTPFISYAIDTDEDWLNHVAEKLEESGLAENTTFVKSDCRVGLFESQMCNYYDNLPNIVPDFIYLDGPDPSHIKGGIAGFTN